MLAVALMRIHALLNAVARTAEQRERENTLMWSI
jgi:hypothetical protein